MRHILRHLVAAGDQGPENNARLSSFWRTLVHTQNSGPHFTSRSTLCGEVLSEVEGRSCAGLAGEANSARDRPSMLACFGAHYGAQNLFPVCHDLSHPPAPRLRRTRVGRAPAGASCFAKASQGGIPLRSRSTAPRVRHWTTSCVARCPKGGERSRMPEVGLEPTPGVNLTGF